MISGFLDNKRCAVCQGEFDPVETVWTEVKVVLAASAPDSSGEAPAKTLTWYFDICRKCGSGEDWKAGERKLQQQMAEDYRHGMATRTSLSGS